MVGGSPVQACDEHVLVLVRLGEVDLGSRSLASLVDDSDRADESDLVGFAGADGEPVLAVEPVEQLGEVVEAVLVAAAPA